MSRWVFDILVYKQTGLWLWFGFFFFLIKKSVNKLLEHRTQFLLAVYTGKMSVWINDTAHGKSSLAGVLLYPRFSK